MQRDYIFDNQVVTFILFFFLFFISKKNFMLFSFANAQGGRIKSANLRRYSWWSFGNHRQRNLID